MSTARYLRLSSLCLFACVTLTWGCGEPEPAESTPTAPPAGFCAELCNHLDAVNKELRCDKDDSGLGETFEVNVASCTSDCDEPRACMDLIVAYDQCLIDATADKFRCGSFEGTPPLLKVEDCSAQFDAAIDCQSDNL